MGCKGSEEIAGRGRCCSHQHACAGGAQQIRGLFGGQRRIDRHRDAGGLRAPQREVRLQQVGQRVGDHVAGADPDRVEQIRGLSDLGEQFAEGQGLGVVERRGVANVRECRRITESSGSGLQQRVG